LLKIDTNDLHSKLESFYENFKGILTEFKTF